MSDKITREIILNASPADVWDVLTDPQKTKLFMFNCEAYSDWNVGSSIVWKGNYQGYESGEKGDILNVITHRHLKYTSIDPNFGIEDIPQNYLHITYDLVSVNNKTELITTIESFNGDPDRIGQVAKGWDMIVLPAIERIFS